MNKKDPETQLLHFDDVQHVFRETYPPGSLFSPIRTKKGLDKMLIEKFGMVQPESCTIGTGLQWKKKIINGQASYRIEKVTYDGYIIPFSKNLANLLKNDDIRRNIETPKPHVNGTYRTVLDGSVYRKGDFFRNHKNALAIIFYYDDVNLANLHGSASKEHKMSMFYWTIANIDPEYRSSQNCTQLYAIVKTKYLKKQGALAKILQSFKSDIKKLETDGLDVEINGAVQNFKGSLLFSAGDTPASALLGGFKESVAALRPCRSCMTNREDWKHHFHQDYFQMRNKLLHEEHVTIVTDPTITKAACSFWKKHYGVNGRSCLMDIMDVTKCLPQDAMHILIEGPLEIACKLFIRYGIEENAFTLDDLNTSMKNFNFGHFKNDKPAPVLNEHLQDGGSLRQSAAQMITLSYTLLFLVREWTVLRDSEDLNNRIDCHVKLLQIMNVSLAYEIREESVDLLGRMIEIFITDFNNLYPGALVPKFHFLIHLPEYIKLFGPARQQWCFRFEAAHAYFKGLIPVLKNFKNMAYSLAYRHQARLCSRLANTPSKKFLYKEDYVAPGQTVLVRNLPFARIFQEIITEADWLTCKMMRFSKLIVNGTQYHVKSIILLQCNDEDLPEFGEISEIFIYDEVKLIVFLKLETIEFDFKLNAYYVRKPIHSQRFVKDVKSLIFPHPLSSFTALGNKYISLINHEHVEFYG